MNRSVPWVSLLLALMIPSFVSAEVARFPDNHAIRMRLAQVITASTSSVLATPSGVYRSNDDATPVRFAVQTQGGFFYLLFLNKEKNGYPLDSQGSYIIKRRESDGSFVQVKIFLNGNPDSFVRIYPMGSRSRMDLFLYGFRMYKDINIPVPFRQVLTDPFAKVIALTSAAIDWSLILPGRPLPEDRIVAGMVQAIRKRLPQITASDRPNGCSDVPKIVRTDDPGGPNCGGFSRWIVDGLYQPRTGDLLSIAALEQRHLELRGNQWSTRYEKARDPYFALDWTRNLAVALTRLDNPQAGPRSDDVTSAPFFQYVENVGYPIRHLEFLLYVLAVRTPGFFYLGALNREYGQKPVLREYSRVVVLFPYFNADGQFEVSVMENNREGALKSLAAQDGNEYIHLVRVAASSQFRLPLH